MSGPRSLLVACANGCPMDGVQPRFEERTRRGLALVRARIVCLTCGAASRRTHEFRITGGRNSLASDFTPVFREAVAIWNDAQAVAAPRMLKAGGVR